MFEILDKVALFAVVLGALVLALLFLLGMLFLAVTTPPTAAIVMTCFSGSGVIWLYFRKKGTM